MQTGQFMWTVNYIEYLIMMIAMMMMMMIAMMMMMMIAMMMMMMIAHAVVQANSSRTVRTIIEDEQLSHQSLGSRSTASNRASSLPAAGT